MDPKRRKHLELDRIEWKSRFASHVTRVAFNLTLSKRMVHVLHIARDCDNQLALPMLVHGTCINLSNRGLIKFRMTHDVQTSRYELTEAGTKVVELLVLAGLIPKEKTIPQMVA